MPGLARSCSQIQSRNGSSFDTAAGREYAGGVSAVNARRIVLRCSPVRSLISRIDSRSTRCMRLISAHCSTPTTHTSSPDRSDQASVRTRPDEPDPAPGGSTFQPAQVGHYSGGAHNRPPAHVELRHDLVGSCSRRPWRRGMCAGVGAGPRAQTRARAPRSDRGRSTLGRAAADGRGRSLVTDELWRASVHCMEAGAVSRGPAADASGQQPMVWHQALSTL